MNDKDWHATPTAVAVGYLALASHFVVLCVEIRAAFLGYSSAKPNAAVISTSETCKREIDPNENSGPGDYA